MIYLGGSTVLFLAALASAALTGAFRLFALRHRILDIPNERSSHAVATPRGGGVAIAFVFSCFAAALVMLDFVEPQAFWGIALPALGVALVGFWDDVRSLSIGTRLVVHVMASLLVLAVLFGALPMGEGERPLWHVLGLAAAGVAYLAWMLNLFNFMDGIDGLAASEAVFVAAAAALLLFLSAGEGWAWLMAFLAAACVGFLLWNWPPAQIFMGDVGSGYLGFVIGAVALATSLADLLSLWVWLILTGTFLADASVTLLRRMLAGDEWYRPHRTHAYQRLADRWGTHGRVVWLNFAINLLWLLPWATVALVYPDLGAACCVIALAPLVFEVYRLGVADSRAWSTSGGGWG